MISFSRRIYWVSGALAAVFTVITGLGWGFARAGNGPEHFKQVDLAGDWRYLPYNGERELASDRVDDRTWAVMSLPSNWYLLGSKQYPPKATAHEMPLASNAPGDLWPVDKEHGLDYNGSVWFRREVDWTGTPNQPIILDLDMVDYYADVYVNGIQAGHHEGYFQRWSLDVTRQMRQGKNVIAVKVTAPALAFDMSQQYPVSWPKEQDQVKGIFLYHDTRPGGTSWRGQERGTGGIIRGIALRESSGVDLFNLTVTPLEVSTTSARLIVEAAVHNWTGKDVDAALRGAITPKNFTGKTSVPVTFQFTAPPGESHARTELVIDHPALWWSWDYGKPNLYQLQASLSRAAGDELLDRRAVTFGVRSISHDENWVWRLNGERIYPRGSNYISTQWLSQADRAWYDRDLKLIVGANLNSIRVHAHLERPEFYDSADEAGVMVWQDFPLQWGYTDLPSFREMALRQAEDMVRLYHNHPSIIVWSMHNESPHAMDWMKKKVKDQNLELDNALASLVHRLDPSRVAHRDSGTGDGHLYPGWYGGQVGDFVRYRGARFVTEYGAEALPALETLKTMFQPDYLWPRRESDWNVWKYADFQPEQTFKYISKGKSIEEFIANSQQYQANLVRFGTEVFRRWKWTRNTGIYHFMFVEDWPSITWAVVDYYRRPKLGYSALQSSMQPVLPSIEYQIDNPGKPISLYAVNDLHREFAGASLKWRITRAGAEGEPAKAHAVDIGVDSVTRVLELGSLPEVSQGTATLQVWIEDRNGTVLGRNSLSARDFVTAAPPEAAR